MSGLVRVAGGGITGLVSAYELLKYGYNVCLYEQNGEPGGLLRSFCVKGEYIERIYHHIFTNDVYALRLIDELGLADKLIWVSPSNGIISGSKLYPFTSPIDLLRFSPIPLTGRIRTGVCVLRASKIRGWHELENYTAKEWLIKNCGRQAYIKLWEPLIWSKFDTDADNVSAVWIWNKFKMRGSSRDKIANEKLGYLCGGFGQIVDELLRRIMDMGGEVKFNTSAPENADIFAVPDSSLVKYKANICVAVVLDGTVSPYYWTTVANASSPFVLIIEQNNLVPNANANIVYLSKYLSIADPLWKASDKEVLSMFFKELKRLLPAFSRTNVLDTLITRSQYSQPVVTRRYSKVLEQLSKISPGSFGMERIYPEDRGVNFAISMGIRAAKLVSTGN